MRIRLFFSFLLFNSLFSCFGLNIQFKDKNSSENLPVFLLNYSQNKILYSDLDGRISLAKNKTYTVKNFGYKALTIIPSTDTTYFLERVEETAKDQTVANNVINLVFKNKKLNDPENSQGFSYNSYNKFFIQSEKTVLSNSIITKIINKFTKKRFEIPQIKNQHYILIESQSERKYNSPVDDEETITNAIFTGIDQPNFITINSQTNSLSLYKGFIQIAGKHYTNPLPPTAQKRYNFEIIDSLKNHYIISFSPKKNARFESLSGIFIINKQDYGIEFFIARPAIKRGNSTVTYQQTNKTLGDNWFPSTIYTSILLENIGSKKHSITATSQTHLYNQKQQTQDYDFSDLALLFSPNINNKHIERQTALSRKDSNTILFYDQLGAIKNFSKSIEFAEKLYHKEIYLKHYSIDLNEVNRLNPHEGLRLGAAIKTNDKFYEKATLGGYLSYGFGDKKAKYGANVSYHLLDDERLSATLSTHTDDFEAGNSKFLPSKAQYSSEWLRKLKINRLDNVVSYKATLKSKPLRFLTLQGSYENKTISPNYNYTFNNINSFSYNTLQLSARYAYGELFIKLIKNKFPLKTNYPIVFFNLSRSFTTNNNLSDYTKLETKIEYTLRLPTLGASIFQLHAGYIDQPVPYGLNFNGKGSREIATVAHNSFETMKYNEFVNNKFIALYYTHDFGYLNFIKWKKFRPKVHVAFNGGFGEINNKNLHKGIEIKDFRKGYFEAGFLVKELAVISLPLVKVSFGIGLYQRIGAYTSSDPWGNQTIKIATGFKL